MKQDSVGRTIALVVAALGTLTVSAGVEYAIWRLRAVAGRSFESLPIMIVLTVAPVLLAPLLFGVAWLGLRTQGLKRIAGVLLLVIGLPATFGLLFSRVWLSLGMFQVVIGDYFRFTGAFLSVLGLYLIFRPITERS